MSIINNLSYVALGVSLANAFNVAANPLTSGGLVNTFKMAVTAPQMLLAGTIMRPGSVLGSLAAAGAAAAVLIFK